MLRRGAIAAVLASCNSAPSVPHLDWPTTASIPLTLATDDYTANVTIGSQTFSLIVDTGSTTTVVAAASCEQCVSAGVSPLYTPGSTAKDTGNHTSGMYVDFSAWDGEIYVDQVGLGDGTPAVPLEFAAMTDEMVFFRYPGSEGIFGMGPPQALDGDTTGFQSTAAESGAPDQIAFELCGGSGTMWIGDYDTSAAASAPMYTPLVAASDTEPYYNLALDDLGIGGTSLGFGASTYKTANYDTGTTEFILPTEAYDMLIAAVDQSAGAAALFPTESLANGCYTAGGVTAAQVDAMLPAMSASFPDGSGGTFSVSSAPTQSYLTDVGSGEFCLAIADGGNGADSATILGQAFLRGFVSIVDLANNRIGFAPDAGCGG
jgi:Eukaryotic aspartyl protease